MSVFTNMGFEEWSALAEDDPQAFEQLRKEVISDFLDHIPEHQQLRLRRLQWRIDQVRDRSSNPMSATLDLYSMMWDRVTGEGGMLDVLGTMQSQASLPQQTADIIEFPLSRE